MRRFLFIALIFTMLMPGMACAGMMYHGKAQKPHCAHCPPATDDGNSKGLMLFKDCAKTDLQNGTGGDVLQKPVFGKVSFFVPAKIGPIVSVAPHADLHSRGPPERLTANVTHPPILLISPRLRI